MQRTEEWISNYNKDYFDRQFAVPYRSTVAFCDWLENTGVLTPDTDINLLDVGTGKGANVYYMAQRYKKARFTGVDINPEFVKEGNEILKAKDMAGRCNLEVADLYNFDKKLKDKFKGIISYQTLSWLPSFAEPLESLAGLNCDWIAMTSLFFDGDVNAKIEIEEYNRSVDEAPKRTFYNIYSLRLIEKHFAKLGYPRVDYVPFVIDIDIPKPEHKIMGTYTEKLNDGKRLQVSGPLLMNWYFVIAKR